MDLQERSLPEVTIKAVVLGVVLSVVLAAANAYLGLFAGMTVSASIPAAVVSMGVLRFFRRSNILENNIVQTAASAGESLAAGVIFTLPALVIMGFWKEFNYLWVTIIAIFGGLLGTLFTIPLRRSLIVEGKLTFPEGVATAEVLKTGERGGRGIMHIALAAVAGGLFKAGAKGVGLWPELVEVAGGVKGSIAYFGSNLSPALLSVGYIVGLNIAVLIFLGGACNWYIAIPICAATSDWPVHPQGHELAGQAISAVDFAGQIWSAKTRYLGVGGMLVGGLWTIFRMRKSLVSGIQSGLKAYQAMEHAHTVGIPRTEKDMPMKWILALIVASVIPLFIVYEVFVRDIFVTLPMAVIMLAAGFVFSAVAGYMAGLVGSSNNPISGVTISTVVVSSLLLVILMGKQSANGPAAAIVIGSVVCCAAAIAGDVMQDLKAGHIVKATPWCQQVMELVGTVAGALVIAPVLMLLYKAYGFKGQANAGPDALAAVQANLMASVSRGVFKGDLPWAYVFMGMAIAVGVIVLDLYLESVRSSFRTPVLAVAIGFYLPLELSVPIFAGGLIAWLAARPPAFAGASLSPQKRGSPGSRGTGDESHNGLLLASGFITGEALMGILLAIPIILLKQIDITLPFIYIDDLLVKMLSLLGIELPFTLPVGAVLGTILLLGVAYWLYRTARGRTKKTGI